MAIERPAARPTDKPKKSCEDRFVRLQNAIREIQTTIEQVLLEQLGKQDYGHCYGRLDLTVFIDASELARIEYRQTTSKKLPS